jgi:uncharacterized protein (TIGR03083 family)
MAPSDPSWNFQDPASKERVLSVLQGEMDAMFGLVADPARWEAPTACEAWEARDVVGHLVDTTEGYLPAFAGARTGASAEEPLGLRDMALHVDKEAKALRKVPREELIGRLRDDSERMMGEFAALSSDDWSGFMVPHKHMGPLPAMFYPMFQIVDYAVHGWDIREGMRKPHAMSGDAADLLVPVTSCSGQQPPTSATWTVRTRSACGRRATTVVTCAPTCRRRVCSSRPGASATVRLFSSSIQRPSCSPGTPA